MTFPGKKFPRSKLTQQQADHIRKCKSNGVPNDSLAAMFGVSASTIRCINHGARWRRISK